MPGCHFVYLGVKGDLLQAEKVVLPIDVAACYQKDYFYICKVCRRLARLCKSNSTIAYCSRLQQESFREILLFLACSQGRVLQI